MQYYKFVNWEARPIEEVLKGRMPQAMLAYDNGCQYMVIFFVLHCVNEWICSIYQNLLFINLS